MATLKQIRARIRSVRSTQQITKAMEMVAAAKLRRSQERVIAARPYAGGISRMLENLAAASENMTLDPESTAARLFEVRPVERRVLVVMASDKGLCGSFNMNVFRSAERHLDGQDRSRVALVAIGRRTVQYFSKRGWTLHPASGEMGDQADLMKARTLALELIRTYKERETDGVELLYTQFISTMSRRVRLEPLLPVTPPAQAGSYLEMFAGKCGVTPPLARAFHGWMKKELLSAEDYKGLEGYYGSVNKPFENWDDTDKAKCLEFGKEILEKIAAVK